MNKLEVGAKVPNFTLKDQQGNDFDIQSLIGKKNMVIYFYPKDDTPGCIREARSFKDAYNVFKEVNAEVIGISSDSITSHRKFCNKYDLPFILLSDENSTIRNKFGVPKIMYGLIPGRVTYVIDKRGEIRYIFNSQLEISKHVKNALDVLKELN